MLRKYNHRILLSVLAFFIAAITAFAWSEKASASAMDAYYNFEYEIISKKNKTCEITECNVRKGDLVIPEKMDGYKVVALADNLFEGLDITSVTISSSVKTIGEYCFARTPKLKKVVLGSSVTTIGERAFQSSAIETVNLPSSLKTIKEGAFLFCENLKSVTVPSSVTKMEDSVFGYCKSLSKATIAAKISVLPSGTFKRCRNLKEVNLPSGITKIEYTAFDCCFSLESVKFSGAEKKVKECSFASSIPRGTIVIPGTVKTIELSAFSNCSAVKSFFIGEGTEKIESGAFSYCKNLTTLVLPSTITEYEENCVNYSENVKVHHKKNSVFYEDTHSYTETVKEPSCAKGYTERKCSCGYAETVNYTSPVIAEHKTVKIKAVKATTSADGKTAGSYCSVCNTVFEKSTVVPKIKAVNLSSALVTYNGKTRKPTVSVVDGKGNKISSSNYTVKFPSKSVTIGKYTVTVTFKGNYSGTVKKTYKIVPKGTSFSRLTRIANGAKLTWSKQATKTSGYQIQYSTKKDFSSAKTLTVSGNKTTSKSIKKLKAKKTYYFRVRTYINQSSEKYYSPWSSACSVYVVSNAVKIISQTQKVCQDKYGSSNYQTASDDSVKVYFTAKNNYPGYRLYKCVVSGSLNKKDYKKLGETTKSFYENYHHLYAEGLRADSVYYIKVVAIYVPERCKSEKAYKKLNVSEKIYDETATAIKFITAPLADRVKRTTTGNVLSWPAVKNADGYIVREEVSKKVGVNIFGEPVFNHNDRTYLSKSNSVYSKAKSDMPGYVGGKSTYWVVPYNIRDGYYYADSYPVRTTLIYN